MNTITVYWSKVSSKMNQLTDVITLSEVELNKISIIEKEKQYQIIYDGKPLRIEVTTSCGIIRKDICRDKYMTLIIKLLF